MALPLASESCILAAMYASSWFLNAKRAASSLDSAASNSDFEGCPSRSDLKVYRDGRVNGGRV